MSMVIGHETGFAYISESIVACMGLLVEVSKVVSIVLKICCREYSGVNSKYRWNIPHICHFFYTVKISGE